MNAMRALLVVSCLMAGFSSTSAFAYKKDYHFRITQILGHWCGLDQGITASLNAWPTTQKLAWACMSVDRFPETDPGATFGSAGDIDKIENRAVFHFPMSEGYPSVRAGSPEAERLARIAIRQAEFSSDDDILVLFGIALHRHEDSWAHNGFEPSLGHLFSGQGPDFPYSAPDHALEMNRAVWKLLELWSVAMKKKGCAIPFEKVEPLLKEWNSEKIESSSELALAWREHARTVLGYAVDIDTLQAPAHLENIFLRESEFARKVLLP